MKIHRIHFDRIPSKLVSKVLAVLYIPLLIAGILILDSFGAITELFESDPIVTELGVNGINIAGYYESSNDWIDLRSNGTYDFYIWNEASFGFWKSTGGSIRLTEFTGFRIAYTFIVSDDVITVYGPNRQARFERQ